MTPNTMGIAAERVAMHHVAQHQENSLERSASTGHDLRQEPLAEADSVNSYFECITACSLDDGDCVTRCVEVLRDQQ